tara:strand:- start:13 stop:519 length:507 start_codon:yes stop_codon:yes gene_type:complete
MPFTPGIKTAYKLSNCNGTMTYIGVSGNMKKRLRDHKNWKTKHRKCTSKIFKGVFHVEELESYDCETRKQQDELERYYFEIYAETNVNKYTPGRTAAEYEATPARKASQAAYYAKPENKIARADYMKAYYKKPANREAHKACMKDNYEKKVIRSVMDGMLDTLEAMHS